MKYYLYTDGSFSKTGVCSYGFRVYGPAPEHKYIHGVTGVIKHKDVQGTRQVAGELAAVKQGIEYILDNIRPTPTVIDLYYDYTGIQKWAHGEWKTKSPITQDYVKFMREVAPLFLINFIKVRAHKSNDIHNQLDKELKHAKHV